MLRAALKPLELIMQRRTLQKQLNTMDNAANFLHNVVVKSVFSQRLHQLSFYREQYRQSFLPTAINLHNDFFFRMTNDCY